MTRKVKVKNKGKNIREVRVLQIEEIKRKYGEVDEESMAILEQETHFCKKNDDDEGCDKELPVANFHLRFYRNKRVGKITLHYESMCGDCRLKQRKKTEKLRKEKANDTDVIVGRGQKREAKHCGPIKGTPEHHLFCSNPPPPMTIALRAEWLERRLNGEEMHMR